MAARLAPARSLLFVPGNRERMVEKAAGLAALDVAIYDLEDGVPPERKDEARRLLAERLPSQGGPRRFVRTNALADGFAADVAAVLSPAVEALVVSKARSADEIREADRIVTERERETGGRAAFVVAIESALALLSAYDLATACGRVAALAFGGEDFAHDLGLPERRTGAALDLAQARAQVAFAAAAARIPAYDGVWPDIPDHEGLRRDCRLARSLGFTGKTLIHPGHIEAVNEAFTPDPADVERARRVLAAFAEAERRGEGALAFEGQLVDRPVAERARALVALAERGGRRPV